VNSAKNQGQKIVFSHVSMIPEIVLFFEYVRERSKKYRKWKEKFNQTKIVRHHFVAGESNCDGISQYKKYE